MEVLTAEGATSPDCGEVCDLIVDMYEGVNERGGLTNGGRTP